MKKLNLDKLVVGVLLGVCLILAIGAIAVSYTHLTLPTTPYV